MERIKRRMVAQFGQPRGVGGRMAGWVMAHRSSNRERNRWVVALLDVRPDERVLEVGFGPGLNIAELARRAGKVYGIDHSAVMVRRAGKRHAGDGRVELLHASVERLPAFDEPLDVIVSVNSLQFWPEPVQRLRELRGLLRPGGRIALANQPRVKGSDTSERLRGLLGEAGFVEQRTETLELDPVVTCVLAVNPK